MEIDAPLSCGEKKYYVIAKLHEKLWTAVYTMRSDAIRIISVRRSRRK
ncbi:BrnT family toxin [Dissulfurispira thermophila]